MERGSGKVEESNAENRDSEVNVSQKENKTITNRQTKQLTATWSYSRYLAHLNFALWPRPCIHVIIM